MRKVLFWGGSVFFLFFLLFSVFFYPHATLVTLEAGLTAGGIKERQTIYSGQFILAELDWREQEIEKKLERLRSYLNLNSKQVKVSSNPFGKTGRMTAWLGKDSLVMLNLDCLKYSWTGVEKSREKIRFELYSNNGGMDKEEKELLNKLKKITKNRKEELVISTCLQGVINGKLNEEQKAALKNRIFQATGTKEKQHFSYSRMSTFGGYTPYIFESMFSKGEKVNIQLAITYDARKNITTILLGSPIIDIDY